MTTTSAIPSTRLDVDPAWIDLYGHMNAAQYIGVFDRVGYELLGTLGVGESHTRETNCGIYTVDIYANYRRELLAGDPLELRLSMLAADEKRLLCLMELYQTRDGFLAATMEQLSIHVDLGTRKVAPFPPAIAQGLQDAVAAHAPHVREMGYAPRLALTRRNPPPAL